jgi:hypothetical protein
MFEIILVFASQKDARNIEHGFAIDHKNVYFLREDPEQYQQLLCSIDTKAPNEAKPTIEADYKTKKVALDPKMPDKALFLGKGLLLEQEMKLLTFLDKNSDILPWSTSDLIGVSRDIIEHKLLVNPSTKPRR